MRQSLSSAPALRGTVVTTTLHHRHRIAPRAGQAQEPGAHHRGGSAPVSYTHLRAHETRSNL
eukprot:8143677-Heterocapsa_arctica.AAC.1